MKENGGLSSSIQIFELKLNFFLKKNYNLEGQATDMFDQCAILIPS